MMQDCCLAPAHESRCKSSLNWAVGLKLLHDLVVCLQLPVPTLANLGIYGHAFLSSGSSVLVGGTNKNPQALLQDFANGIRWTVVSGHRIYQTCSLQVDHAQGPSAVPTAHCLSSVAAVLAEQMHFKLNDGCLCCLRIDVHLCASGSRPGMANCCRAARGQSLPRHVRQEQGSVSAWLTLGVWSKGMTSMQPLGCCLLSRPVLAQQSQIVQLALSLELLCYMLSCICLKTGFWHDVGLEAKSDCLTPNVLHSNKWF